MRGWQKWMSAAAVTMKNMFEQATTQRINEIGKPLMFLTAVTFALQLQAFAAVPTYTGCYSASSGTVNKLALGFSPQKSCNSGDIMVTFSGGDITKISVSGGLTGGGDNGDVSISLDPKYSMPQNCPQNYIAKWSGTAWMCSADQNTTYTNGAGLSLNGADNAFSILPGYRLPQNCSDGNVPQSSGGIWSCVAPSKGTHAYAVTSTFSRLEQNTSATIATLTVPSGLYVIVAKARLINRDPDTQPFGCQFKVDGTTVDSIDTRLGGSVQADIGIAVEMHVPFVTSGQVNQTISITCNTFLGVAYGVITAIPVTTIN